MAAKSLEALAALLGETSKKVQPLGREFQYVGGSPAIMRQYITSKNKVEDIFTVVAFIYLVVACLLYGTSCVKQGSPNSTKSASWTPEARDVMR
eukprot:3903459-Amphidinium_carterae.1